MIKETREWVKKNQEETLRDFFTLLKFKSISTDPAFKQEVANCALWLKGYLEKLGLKAEVWATQGHPTLFASHLKAGPSRPTLLLYHHYDVQPVDPLELWTSDPFQPEIREGNVYARGAVDSKGQCFYTMTALKAFFQLAGSLNFNLKIVIEGEEEIGSPGLLQLLKTKKEFLKADACLVVDVDLLGKENPAITLGIRGVMSMEVEAKAASADLHSGIFGGIVMNPARALIAALGRCWKKDGTIAIPHFYDNVKKFTKKELASFDFNIDVKTQTKTFDVTAFAGEGKYSLLESNWIRPVLEINGFGSGYVGKGFKTIIPGKAIAKLSCRLVPNQDPKKIKKAVEDFLKKNMAKGIDFKLELGSGGVGFIASPNSKIAKISASAYEEVFGKKCKRILCGATIPIAPELSKLVKGNLVLVGMGLPSDRPHSPNEHFGLDRFEKGVLAMVKIFELFAKQGK